MLNCCIAAARSFVVATNRRPNAITFHEIDNSHDITTTDIAYVSLSVCPSVCLSACVWLGPITRDLFRTKRFRAKMHKGTFPRVLVSNQCTNFLITSLATAMLDLPVHWEQHPRIPKRYVFSSWQCCVHTLYVYATEITDINRLYIIWR